MFQHVMCTRDACRRINSITPSNIGSPSEHITVAVIAQIVQSMSWYMYAHGFSPKLTIQQNDNNHKKLMSVQPMFFSKNIYVFPGFKTLVFNGI